MTHVTIGRWGNSLALRIPGDLAALSGLRDGEAVDITAEADGLVIRRATPRIAVGDLFRGKTAAEWRALYAGAYDWGPDIGHEAIEA